MITRNYLKNLKDVGIILIEIPMHFCQQICKPLKPHAKMILATQPAGSANNAARCTLLAILLACFAFKSKVLRKCQEPPRTDKNQKLTNADLRTTHYSTPSTKLDPPRRTLPTIRGRRCSRRMAHSDIIKAEHAFTGTARVLVRYRYGARS